MKGNAESTVSAVFEAPWWVRLQGLLEIGVGGNAPGEARDPPTVIEMKARMDLVYEDPFLSFFHLRHLWELEEERKGTSGALKLARGVRAATS